MDQEKKLRISYTRGVVGFAFSVIYLIYLGIMEINLSIGVILTLSTALYLIYYRFKYKKYLKSENK